MLAQPFESVKDLIFVVPNDRSAEEVENKYGFTSHALQLTRGFCEQAMQYTWVEGWSEQYERPFFFNQETQESVWDRPPDLAWRRVTVQEEL